ncbi:hypothetical protein PanWU01x14_012340 [Parasponia andersonii]|uniref:Uncharacterized protein n=1 Tax=Parasponia andersonii TaxID=3476 RepID=A0A2P5E1S3_PARAD|nr:hypothetical protein PanWU01x14_012340 [Parasponia andersonii]
MLLLVISDESGGDEVGAPQSQIRVRGQKCPNLRIMISELLSSSPILLFGDFAVAYQAQQVKHQVEEKLISYGMSSKILNEALIQLREVEDEEARPKS